VNIPLKNSKAYRNDNVENGYLPIAYIALVLTISVLKNNNKKLIIKN
jgi:hypothetical protein